MDLSPGTWATPLRGLPRRSMATAPKSYFSRQLRCKDCKPVGPDGKVKLVDIKLMNPGAYDKVLEGMGLKKRANPAAGVRTGVEGIQ